MSVGGRGALTGTEAERNVCFMLNSKPRLGERGDEEEEEEEDEEKNNEGIILRELIISICL
jgi:hypothetical protein